MKLKRILLKAKKNSAVLEENEPSLGLLSKNLF